MNIAGRVFDLYDDYQLKIASAHTKELAGITVLDPIEVEKLPDKDFALIMKTGERKIRKYPINDAEAEKLSRCYFEHQKNEMHPEIAKTAEAGFARQKNEIDISKLASHEVVSTKWHNYPLHNEEHVKEAVARFSYTTQRLSPAEKYDYAQAIIKQASALSVMVDGSVLDYINYKVDPLTVKLACDMRKRHIIDSSLKEDLDELSKNAHPEAFVAFDKIAGLTHLVEDGAIPDGYASCYALSKVAELEDEKIKNIPLQTIERVFDPAFAKEWAKDPVAVYKSLPTPTKGLIDKQAALNIDAGKAIPAALAMLAVASVAKTKGADSVMDKQFGMKGWVPSAKKGVLYERNEEEIVRKDSKYHVVDADKHCVMSAASLPALYNLISGEGVKNVA